MLSSEGEEMCIFFGSWVAMFAIDLTNQIIFVDCAFFISIMQVVLIRVAAASGRRRETAAAATDGGSIVRPSLRQQAKEDTEKEIVRAKRFMRWFVVAFGLCEIVILTLKGTIYLSDRDWWNAHDFSAMKIVFFVLHICRMVFPFTLIVKLGQEVR